MSYPTKDEFSKLLNSRDHGTIVEEFLIAGLPYVFKNSPTDYDALCSTIGSAFTLAVDTMTVIGSGRIGYSLSPDKYGAPFSTESDIDVAVVNAELFDTAWFELLRLSRKKYFSLEKQVQSWIAAHREGHIFWGFVCPDRLPGVVGLSRTWFRTFKGLARIPTLAGRDVNGRLYRTWEHVKIHQLNSLRTIQRALRTR